MSEHDDRRDHDEKADEVERELDDLQERSENLGDQIEGAGEDWERRKKDESVPGATGEPRDEEDDDDGDTQPTSSAGTGELDFGRALADTQPTPSAGTGDGDDDGEEKG
jgi:hypothetical protein